MKRWLLAWSVALGALACASTADVRSDGAVSKARLPSRAEILEKGGLFAIPVPLTWKLIDAEGNDEAIPTLAGAPLHRILAQGALLATEVEPVVLPQAMTFRRYELGGPVNNEVLERYAQRVLQGLVAQNLPARVEQQQMLRSGVSGEPFGKLFLRRQGREDDRAEIHYLLRDKRQASWALVYLIRPAELPQWAPLLAEIELAPEK